MLRQAIRLNPFQPYSYRISVSLVVKPEGMRRGSLHQEIPSACPQLLVCSVTLVTLYSYAGRENEARAAAAEVLRIAPNFSIDGVVKEIPWKEGPKKDRVIDALRKAGLK